ncbi:MAG: SPOR domain-containing protein [Flavobacteriales bacterium]|nr:SPOR domain-containing protein [Flavobacteriales bacterium]
MGIERDLHDLLYAHDCVIVPQWGGFLTHYRPARLDEPRKLIHPPGKELSFNRHLVRNDGLLADRLAKREGLAFDVASNRIDNEVAGWRETLDRSGRLELERIGIFFRDAEHNLQFDPDKRSSFLKDAFGLRPLAAMPVVRMKPAPSIRPAPLVVPMPGQVRNPGNEERHRPMWWAAAAIATIVFGAAAIWAYRMGGNNGQQWGGFEFLAPAPAATYRAPNTASIVPVEVPHRFELPEGDGVRNVPLSTNDSITLIVDLGPSTAVADTTAVAVRTAPLTVIDARYHVVGGCFAQPENADKKLNELLAKGWPARRLPVRGRLHPVVFGSYATRAEALAALSDVRGKGDGAAWLLVR